MKTKVKIRRMGNSMYCRIPAGICRVMSLDQKKDYIIWKFDTLDGVLKAHVVKGRKEVTENAKGNGNR